MHRKARDQENEGNKKMQPMEMESKVRWYLLTVPTNVKVEGKTGESLNQEKDDEDEKNVERVIKKKEKKKLK